MTKFSSADNTNLTLEYCYKEILKLVPSFTKTDFAQFIKRKKQNIGQRIQRGSKLTASELDLLRSSLEFHQIPTKFLDLAKLPLDRAIVQIPIRSEVELSCGTGSVSNADYATEVLAFDTNYLRKVGGNPDTVSIVYARGDSMKDKIESGDALIVDESKKDIVDGCIYAFVYNSELYCKQIQKLPNTLRAISLNKEYKPFNIEQGYDFNIIGQVISLIKSL